MGRKIVSLLMLFLILLLSGVFVSGGDVLTIEANIFGSTIGIEVSEYLHLGDVSKGFQTDEYRIDVNNTGNTAVLIYPEFAGAHEELFNQLYFSKRLSGDDYNFLNVSDFTLDIAKPTTLGGIKGEYFYVKLDLRNFSGNIPNGINLENAKVKFIAIEK